jgi:hypothetical protein
MPTTTTPQAGAAATPQNAPTEDEGHVHATSINIAMFEGTMCQKWFAILDQQFMLHKIRSDKNKCALTLGKLPANVIRRITTPVIESGNFATLRQHLEKMFKLSESESLDKLMSNASLTFTKPTLYLRELRDLAQSTEISDNLLKHKFLKALPTSIQPTIVALAESKSLDEVANMADAVMSYDQANAVCAVKAAPPPPLASMAIQPPTLPNTMLPPPTNSVRWAEQDYYQNVQQIEPRQPLHHQEQQQQNFSRNNWANQSYSGRGNSRQGDGENFQRGAPWRSTFAAPPSKSFFDDEIPQQVRAFQQNQSPRVCRYHLYFGHSARRCIGDCILKDQQETSTNLDFSHSRPSSRSSSPAPYHNQHSLLNPRSSSPHPNYRQPLN